MLRAGDQIGPYTLISKLGRGAFGVVWLTERRTTITTTTAALKVPLDDDVDLETIRQEANLWVRASGHPNVLPIIEANVYDDQVVIASEYAPDGSLEAWLKQNGGKSPSIEAAVDIVSGILTGLEHLHSRNIIHRDLKPANILFQGSTPRLADFGISRVLKSTSQSSIVAGTPTYMAPEAFDGKRNEQTDIWSAGVIFYQLLAGRLPFPQADITSLVGAILSRNPEPLPIFVPSPLHEVIARALAKDPRQRYKSAAEMRADLRNPRPKEADRKSQYATEPITTIPAFPAKTFSPTPPPLQPTRKSSVPSVIYAVAGLLAVLIVVVGIVWLKSGATNINSTNSSTLVQNNANVRVESSGQSSPTATPVNRTTTLDSWEGTVSARDSGGVRAETSNGRRFMVSAGDEIEIRVSGIVQVRSDGSPSGPEGETGYRDPYVDSPYYDRVGGLEMWIGPDRRANRYFVGSYFRQRVSESGFITFRVIDALSGYKGTGSFRVTVRKING